MPLADGTAGQVLTTDGAGVTSWAASTSSTGLEQVTEGGNTGRRLAGVDTAYYGNIGNNAVDLSYSDIPFFNLGAIGTNSTALGYRTTASENGSTAMGVQTTASGNISTAMGYGTTASGLGTTAMGWGTTASGFGSTAMGMETYAPSFGETAIGIYNTNYTPNNTSFWDGSDRIFSIGNGVHGSTSSNALTIYKDGKMNINDAYDMPLADGTAGQVLTTDGAGVTSWAATTDNQTLSLSGDTLSIVDGNSVVLPASSSTGLEQVTEGGNTGRRLAGANPNNYGDIGADAVDLSYSYSSSNTRGATGTNSTAMGVQTTASGDVSTAMGLFTTSSGVYATAMGYVTSATGVSSTAMGESTTASGYASTAMGNNVNATGSGELYNSGNVKGASFTSTSDRRVKKNIQDFSGALDKVLQLNARTYYYNVEEYPRFEAEKDKPQIGFIAQEVEQVLPEMVLTDGDQVGLKGVRYGQLTPVLVEAIKEMKADYENKIETQEVKIETQERKIEIQQGEIRGLSDEVAELRSMVNQLLENE
jgi:hypothetical protein